MSWYAQSKAAATLFVHYDKNVYTPSETVWFSAYLLNSRDSLSMHNTLSVALIGDNDRTIWVAAKFVLSNGLCSGSLPLPDSLLAGHYTLLAYTNQLTNSYPEAFFIQPVTIKTAEPSFRASLTLNLGTPSTDTVGAILRVLTPQLLALPGAEVRYSSGTAPEHPSFTKTDGNGEVNFTFSARQLTSDNSTLYVQVRSGGENKMLNLTLPTLQTAAMQVRFYPEGGYLIAGLASVVAWEAKMSNGVSTTARGILFEGQQPIDTIETSPQGLGRFTLTPKKGQVYTMRLLNNNRTHSAYPLPVVLPQGTVLTLHKAVANDTLQLEVQNNLPDQTLYLLLHNYRQIVHAFTLNGAQKRTLVAIPLDDLPKGVGTVTLLDSTGRPRAERLFFAHSDHGASVEVRTDSSNYKTRSKVTLHLKLKDKDGKLATGLLSLACVQAQRLDKANAQDIKTYTYLTHELANWPFASVSLSGDKNMQTNYENALLVRGWRRYTWTELLAGKQCDTTVQQTSLVFTGAVTQNGKQLKKHVSLSVINSLGLNIVTTDSKGNFQLPAKMMITQPSEKLSLLVNVPDPAAYQITFNDPYEKMNEQLAPELAIGTRDAAYNQDSTQILALNNNEHGKVMAAVVVRTKAPVEHYHSADPNIIGRNECGDYVCISGVLNCPVHKDDFRNKPPVVGRTYYHYASGLAGGVRYEGCTTNKKEKSYTFKIDGVFAAQELYSLDEALLASSEPAYFSTLYWNPSILVEENHEVTLSFYTSDIEGKFKIIVQGRTRDDVVYGESSFTVKNQPADSF